MLRRKSDRPFFISSLIIHLIVALIMMRMWVEPYEKERFYPNIEVDIIHTPRPVVFLHEPVKSPPPAKPVETVKEPSAPKPPKPKSASASEWLAVDAVGTNQRTARMAKPEQPSHLNVIGSAPSLRDPGASRPKGSGVPISTAAPPKADSSVTLPPGEGVGEIAGEGALTANSPDVGLAKPRGSYRRGETLGGAPLGNASGGGSAGPVQGNYIAMMTDLARNLAAAATTREIDLVFIIDKTGSMEDNVRGVRAYIDLFFEHLTRAGHDTAAGLVTFADTTNQDKPKARGVTEDLGKFKNWLYKIEFEGGGDLTESGLDALMAALREIKFRRGAQRFFVLASDGTFHDADYDGRSEYSLDSVIDALRGEGVRVDVIGLDYLPIQQLAWATGGTWRVIPGKGYLEYVPPTLTAKMLSEFGALGFRKDTVMDELIVYVNRNPRPVWLKVTWKVLNPLGEICYGPFTDQVDIPNDGSEVVKFTPAIDVTQFRTMKGTYTVIYHLENNLGHRSILRRVFDVP
jgi:hypothetical protein